MKDQAKTKEQLINELLALRQRIAGLEVSEAERKQAEEALRSAHGKLRATFDAIQENMNIVDLNFYLTDVNEVLIKAFGLPDRESVLGRKCFEVLKGQKDICPNCAVAEAYQSKAPVYRTSTPADEVSTQGRSFEIFAYPIKDEHGNLSGAVEFARDITERKRTEDALRESEHRFRMLVETMKDGLGVQDENGIITYVNQRVCELTGYSREELVGRPATDLLEEPYRSVYAEEFAKRRDGISSTYELTWTGKDGGKIVTLSSSAPIFDLEGNFKGSFSVFTDITDRKQAEDALRESEERHRLLLESSPDPIVVYDMERKATYVNPAFESTFGWSSEELLGKRIDFVPEESWPETRAAIARMVKGERILSFETKRLTKDGQILDIQLSSSLFKDRDGNPAGNIVILRDISERKRAEEALLESENYFRSLLFQLYEDILVIDRGYQITDVNKSFLATTGRAREDMIGHHCYEISHGYNEPCDMKGEECPLHEVFETGEPRSCRHRHTRADGSKAWVDIFLSPLRDQGGNVTHVIEGIRDVTDFIKMEEDLRASEEKFRALFDHIPTMAFVIDKDHRLIAHNWAFAEKMGDQTDRNTSDLLGVSESTKEFWHGVEKQVIESGHPTWYMEVVESNKRGRSFIECRK